MRTFPFGTQTGIEEDPVLRELRETEPVCKVRLITGGQAWLITRYDHVRMVESDPRFSRAEAPNLARRRYGRTYRYRSRSSIWTRHVTARYAH